MKEYALICDPGKKRDSASVMIMRHTAAMVRGNETIRSADRIIYYLDIIFLEKFMRMPYPELVRYLGGLARRVELSNNVDLILDADGVGEAVVDMLAEDGLNPIPILATPGNKVTEVQAGAGEIFGPPGSTKLKRASRRTEIHVPKEDLVAAGRRVLEQRRLRVPRSIKWVEDFDKQLVHFKGLATKKVGHFSYNADDPNVHDDFVSDFLLGAWWFTRERKDSILRAKPLTGSGKRTGWDPMDHL